MALSCQVLPSQKDSFSGSKIALDCLRLTLPARRPSTVKTKTRMPCMKLMVLVCVVVVGKTVSAGTGECRLRRPHGQGAVQMIYARMHICPYSTGAPACRACFTTTTRCMEPRNPEPGWREHTVWGLESIMGTFGTNQCLNHIHH